SGADGPRGAWVAEAACQIAVAQGRGGRNRPERVPHAPLEGGASARVERYLERRPLAGEVLFQLPSGALEHHAPRAMPIVFHPIGARERRRPVARDREIDPPPPRRPRRPDPPPDGTGARGGAVRGLAREWGGGSREAG